MLTELKNSAGVRCLLALLLFWAGTSCSLAQSFSFPRLRLAATNGLTNRVFTAGDRVVPEVTVSNGVWYRVTVRDSGGMVKNPSAVCTPTTAFNSTDNSYVIQPGDAPTTNGTYKFIVETFPGGACSGPPINIATQQFYVVAVTAYTNQALTAETNRFTTGQTAFLRVEGMPPNTLNWNVTWIQPNGSASGLNTNGNDRPDVGANSELSSSYLAYPPSNSLPDVWNQTNSYETSSFVFSTTNQGEWKLRLQLGVTNQLTLPAYLLSNDCVAVTINPLSRANCVGTAATFTAVTNGTGPFTLVWRKDGAVIPGVTGTVLNIPSVTTATAGVFSVESTGPCGSATNFATLFVTTAMTAQSIPPQTVCSNDTVIFIAPTNGGGLYTFQWRRTNSPIAGATNNVLILPNVTLASAGDYRVVVTNACNFVTNIGSLAVTPGLTVTPLTNLVRYVGTFASFSTTASAGSGATNFNWRKDGVIIPGQTNRSLMLSNLALADSGNYTVTASRINGCSASAAATLLVAYCFNSLDVMMVIDRSGSMTGSPYADARTAATNFVRNLILGTNADIVGLVSYNPTATLDHQLSANSASVEAAISALPAAAGGTCISCGLNTAQAELTSIRHRVGALPVMVLLTDGVPKTQDGDSVSQVLSNAQLAKLAGTRIFTMGLDDGTGANVDRALLAATASSTNDFFYVNNSSQLTAVFDQISAILCRGPNSIRGPTPSNAVVCAGQTVQFDVSATGCAIFTFEWRHDGVPLPGQTNPSLILPNVTDADSGVYAVVISSFCGSVTNSASLTVNSPAQILIGAMSQTVCAGANVNFNVLAGGSGLTYQWRHGFTNLPGQTNATLALTGVTTADAGNYTVLVSGLCGGTVGNTAALTVRIPPALTPLSNVTACPGTPVLLQTTTNGTGPLTIVWRKDGIVISSSNQPALHLGAVNSASAGSYAVEVTGPCGSATNFALVTVLKNTAATPLADQTLCAGEPATFTTTPDGTGPLTLVWRRNGVFLPGATNATLSLPSLTTNDAGSYTVEVSGPCGIVTRGAMLTVRALTTATPLTSAEQCEGGAVTFSTVAQGIGPFIFAWRHDGVLVDGANSAALMLTNLSLTNAGVYSVEITGACNSVTNSTTLLVRVLTTATPLTDATRCSNESVTFSTTAGGSAPLTFVWRQNGVELPGEISATLTRTNLATNDAGVYSVEVTGACGTFTNTATLTVLELVTATPLSDAMACEGETISLATVASGAGPLTFVWRHGGAVMDGATNSILTISNAGVAHAGSYSVEVTGVCNAVTNTATLAVRLLTTATALEDLTVCVGGDLETGPLVSGTGPFNMVWRRDGTVLAGQTSEVLYLEPLTTNDAGLYSVEVTGACNSVTNSFVLTVLPLTTVEPLTDQLVCPGANAAFTAQAAGAGPFLYFWRHDGLLLSNVTATLALTNISPADVGRYTVTVSGQCGFITRGARLDLRPSISATPLADAVRCAGEVVNFSTTISGPGPWQIVWRRNGEVLPGETNTSLALASVSTNDAGIYSVEISGLCNSVTNAATLTVNSPVTAMPLADVSVCSGGAVTFQTTPGGSGPFTFVWRREGAVMNGVTNASLTLTNLSTTNAGVYSVEVSGVCGSITNSATLTVLQLLTATPFADAVRCTGEPLSFNTTISGTGPRQIVWRRNGEVLTGETNSSLSFASVSTNDAGIYSVEISGLCNSVTNTATLTVKLPVTATPLAEVTACAGGAVTFQTTPGGTGPFTFVWRQDGLVLAGATNSTLSLLSLSPTNAGIYSVEVRGVCGSITNAATLTVRPLITTTPMTSITNCVGQIASFFTTPSGSGPWTFVWRRNEAALPGETNGSLAFASVTTNDAGLYSVEISGPCNTVTNAATLTVRALTTVSPLADATVCEGALVFLSVQVQGAGPHSYSWRRNGQLIITTPSLIIGSATVADSGVYSVEVIGACNRVTNSATITVHALTTVVPLTNAVRCAGDSASFNAITGGTGPFTYGWRKNGTPLPGETNSTLLLNSLTTNDAASYSVQVTGACNVVTRSASLVVNEPVLATPLTNAARCVGEPVNFMTTLSGTGPFSIRWRKDGLTLTDETNSSLAFIVASTNDAGNYAVEITGACGAVTNLATLVVHPPITLSAVPDQMLCAGESVTLDSGLQGAGALVILWRRDGEIISTATKSTLLLTNLSLADSGVYQVEVTSPCVALTNVMQVTVAAPPLALLNEARCVGDTVVFRATASTNAPFSFAWRHDGVLLAGATNSTLALGALATNAGGVYSVEVDGACGRVTNSAALTILQPPSIAPLANQAQCAGANVTFNAVVSGSGPFLFAWRKDGVLISGATNSSLSLTNVTPAHTALYSVEAVGVCASATNAATLTVSTVPVIATLTNFPVCLGQDALLAPVITGVGEFTKLWRKDGVELAGETNGTLFLGAVSNATAGIYTLEVSGACGRATNHTTLTLRTNVLVAALSNQTVCAGGATTFTANVTGTGPFTFVWRKNGAVLSNVTSGVLALTNLFPADGALYTVEVTTFCNTASASALLTVESSLTASPLTNLTACVGQNVTFSTTASGGPAFTYLWRRDGSALTNQTNATLVLTNVQSANAGNYSVEVTGCGRATNSAQLAVTPPVTATLAPVLVACACDDLTLAPTNLAPGNYSFAWRKNGALLAGETGGSLRLPMLNMHSPGIYSVEIAGPCNTLTLQTTLQVINVNSGTWTNNDGGITIRDFDTAAPYPSTNFVRCAPKTMSQLRVTLFGLTHFFPDDMDLALVAPNGQGIKLMSDNGGGGGNALLNINLTFDDAAASSLPNNGFITPGTYRPTDINEGALLVDSFPAPGPAPGFTFATNLAAFLGSNPNGAWKLFIVDDHGGQQGSLTRWVLDFGRNEFVFPNVRLTSPMPQTNGAFQMELRGEPGKTYFLEASTNLLNWTIIQTNQLLAPTMQLTDETAPQFGYRFYRASGCRE